MASKKYQSPLEKALQKMEEARMRSAEHPTSPYLKSEFLKAKARYNSQLKKEQQKYRTQTTLI